MAALAKLLPTAAGHPGAPGSGRVFKIERSAGGEKVAYVRMFSGTVRARHRLSFGRDRDGKVTAIEVSGRGSFRPTTTIQLDTSALEAGTSPGGAGRAMARRCWPRW